MMQNVSQEQLRQFVEQIERLEEEKKDVSTSIKEKYDEAASSGFDKRILKAVIRLRKKSTAERQEEDTLLDTYLHALNMLPE